MGSIIVSLPRATDSEKITSIIRNAGMSFELCICETGSEVLRIANDRDFGVVICSKHLRDMGYYELAGILPPCFKMIVLTKDMSLETGGDAMVKLLLPLKPRDLINTIDMLLYEYIRRPRKKKTGYVRRNEEENKIVDEAKHLLMERNGMSEPEAFRYIQKNSMDYSRKLVESAQMILTLLSDG
ncbi:MAG: ANTAR domain-containing protein [Clostridiales bacterium]|nr:ANTAR domain-containing protein [Clostridiales bacterium]